MYELKEDELAHYGVLGMKWGVRRYQNPDGSLTNAGKKRLAKRVNSYVSTQTSITKNINSKDISPKKKLKRYDKSIEFAKGYLTKTARLKSSPEADKFIESRLRDYTSSYLTISDDYKKKKK